MTPQYSVALAPYTSLNCGGTADTLYKPATHDELVELLKDVPQEDELHILGFGSNSLISDDGLRGTTIVIRQGSITFEDSLAIADAGAWWDDLVKSAVERDLWGLELTSEIPSSVGGAIIGNIAAYGQQVSDTLVWVEVFNRLTREVERIDSTDIELSYRASSLQQQPHLIILRAGFQLSHSALHQLKYDSALKIADELQEDISSLVGCRRTIIETRKRAGSIYHPGDPQAEHTAGSFFKNPLVSVKQAELVAGYDETGKTLERVLNQSKIHGGSAQRASAAHVLLAAGFKRGQTWGSVRLHPDHVLKIETLDGATATDVYSTAQHIIKTVKQKLDITLVAEVKYIGTF